MPNFKELGFKVGPSFSGGRIIRFQLWSKMRFLQGLKPSFPMGLETNGLTKKKGTNLETKLLEVRHMSRPKFFYLGLPNSLLKLVFLNVCGLPYSDHDHHPLESLIGWEMSGGPTLFYTRSLTIEVTKGEHAWEWVIKWHWTLHVQKWTTFDGHPDVAIRKPKKIVSTVNKGVHVI